MNRKSLLKIIIGFGVVALGIASSTVFFGAFKTLVLGALGPLLVLVGFVIVAIAKE